MWCVLWVMHRVVWVDGDVRYDTGGGYVCRCAGSGRCVGDEEGYVYDWLVRDIVWCLGWPHGPCGDCVYNTLWGMVNHYVVTQQPCVYAPCYIVWFMLIWPSCNHAYYTCVSIVCYTPFTPLCTLTPPMSVLTLFCVYLPPNTPVCVCVCLSN